MKKLVLFHVLVLCMGVFFAGSVFSIEFENESEYYPVTYPIHKVYRFEDAYKIDFIRDDYKVNSFWVRYDWINGSDRIGSINYGEARQGYPALTLYYRNGELDFFRLYLIENRADQSWAPILDYEEDLSGIPAPDAKPEIVF